MIKPEYIHLFQGSNSNKQSHFLKKKCNFSEKLQQLINNDMNKYFDPQFMALNDLAKKNVSKFSDVSFINNN